MKVRLLAMIMTTSMLFSACSLFGSSIRRDFLMSGASKHKTIEEILDALECKDAEKLRELFSSEAVASAQSFDDGIDSLFEYFSGTFVSYDSIGGSIESTDMDYGDIKKEICESYDITTSDDTYRIAFREVTEDTKNPNNVGVWSMYIIRKEDDTNPEYSYHGDGKYTPGINIGVKNVPPVENP